MNQSLRSSHRPLRALLALGLLAALTTRGQQVVSTQPTQNATAAPANTLVSITTNVPNQPLPLRVFSSQAGGQKKGTQATVGATTRFTPNVGFIAGERVMVSIPSLRYIFDFTVAASRSSATFSGTTELPVGGGGPLVVGDVDGDNDLDLFAVHNSSVSIRLNDGTGQFSGSTEVAVAGISSGVALGDVDGDGDLDLLTANNGSVSVRFNDGAGQFSGTTQVDVLGSLTSLVLGDVDGDGDLDILTANYNSVKIQCSGSIDTLQLERGKSRIKLRFGPFSKVLKLLFSFV